MFEWCCPPVSRADVEEVTEEGRRARRRSACVAPDLGGGGKAPYPWATSAVLWLRRSHVSTRAGEGV